MLYNLIPRKIRYSKDLRVSRKQTYRSENDKIDEKYLINDKNVIVIQVNGKKRNTLSIKENLKEKELVEQIKNKQLISKYLDNGELIKTIYIKNRLINFIIK